MKLVPLSDRVVLKQLEAEETTKSGIILTSSAQEKPQDVYKRQDKYFTNTVSRIGGITLQDIENDVNELHSAAYDPLGLETDVTLDSKGRHKMRSGADDHLYNPCLLYTSQGCTAAYT